jgi:chromosome segregation ATPase
VTCRFADLQSKLFTKTEEFRLLEAKDETLSEEIDVLKKRHEELAEKLRQARDSEVKVEEHYRQELLAQTNLANHYKSMGLSFAMSEKSVSTNVFLGHCEESEKKSAELEKAVSELQGLVKKSEERYGALEDTIDQTKQEHKEEIQRRNEAIRALKKELEDANELVKTLKSKGKEGETMS